MTECKECHITFEKTESFHRHLKKHRLNKKSYYEKYYPRFCLATNKKIIWKESDVLDEYLSRDFFDKTSLNNYFSTFFNNEEKLKLLNCYLSRSCQRHCVGVSEVEWSSLQLASNIIISDSYFNYQEKCAELGFKTRYDYSFHYKDFKLPIKKIPVDEFCINTDTREQSAYSFFSSITNKLDIGDYALAGNNFNNITIERKSIQDFGGTMGSGIERFENELKRTRELGRYLIVLVEYPLSEIYGYKFFGRCQAGYFLHNMRNLLRDYSDCVQFVFGGYRYQCIKLVPLFLLCGEAIKKIDLQLWCEYNNAMPSCNTFTKNDLIKLYDNLS